MSFYTTASLNVLCMYNINYTAPDVFVDLSAMIQNLSYIQN